MKDKIKLKIIIIIIITQFYAMKTMILLSGNDIEAKSSLP